MTLWDSMSLGGRDRLHGADLLLAMRQADQSDRDGSDLFNQCQRDFDNLLANTDADSKAWLDALRSHCGL